MSSTKQQGSDMLLDPILFNAATSHQGAALLVRRMIRVAITSILYQRIDIDRSEFVTRERNGIPYRVFKDKLKTRILIEIRNWIRGVLDAFDKNYLREIYLLFCNINDDTDVKESYKFQIKYFKDNELALEAADVEVETLNTTEYLLKSINTLEAYKKFQQDEITPYIALTYYSDVTPDDYEPPFYGGNDERVTSIMMNVFRSEKHMLYLGALKTKSYRMKCRGKGKLFMIPENTSSEYTSVADKTVDELQSMDADEFNSKQKDKDENNLSESMAALTDDQCITLSDEDTCDNLDRIQCPCALTNKFQNIPLIQCSGCYSLLHAPCLNYLYSSTIPENILCDRCDESSYPTPQQMIKRQTQSIYRLAVAYGFLNNTFPTEVLDKSSQKYKNIVMEKLLAADCIKSTSSGYSLDVEKLEKKVVNKLFSSNTILPDSNNLLPDNSDDDANSINLSNPIKKLRIK